jgi:hypothetical protein
LKVHNLKCCRIRSKGFPAVAFLLAILVFHGCAGIYSVVEFEVLEPATVNLPEQVRQLLVMNRAPLTFDAFDKDDMVGLDERSLYILDTLIIRSLNRGLLQVLQQSPIERFHHPLWYSERRFDTTALDDLILTRREVDAICQERGADAILSLEFYSMDPEVRVQYYSDDSGIVSTRYYELSNKVRWVIYLPGSPTPFDTYNMVDTLFFPEIVDGELVGFPSAVQMIRESFYNSGTKYGRYLVPVWVHTSRLLYKGKEDSLKLASRQTGQGAWDSAYAIWEGLSAGTDSTTVAKALYNMAIYHELEDDLDTALAMVTKSLQYDTLEVVQDYSEELNTRILNRKALLNQVR